MFFPHEIAENFLITCIESTPESVLIHDLLPLPVFLSVSTGSGKLSFPRTSWRNSPDSRSLA